MAYHRFEILQCLKWIDGYTILDKASPKHPGKLPKDFERWIADRQFPEFITIFENHKKKVMNEIIFIVRESPEGGYEGRALEYSIFVEGETYDEIKGNIRDAVHCHFDDDFQRIIRIHFTKEEIFMA
jgi:hypothetical protein